MLMTKEQAFKTWCPMVRLAACQPDGNVVSGQTVMNRLQNGKNTACPDSAMCIADRCAMWRWEPKYDAAPPAPRHVRGVLTPPAPAHGKRIESTHGYCGLAGRPA